MHVDKGGIKIGYEIHGAAGPWVIFSHSLGCSRKMWSHQIEALSGSYRVLAYDLRGHGESTQDDAEGGLDLFVQDVLAVMDHEGIPAAHFVGISIGGMIGQVLASKYPERVKSLVAANTSCYMPPAAQAAWDERIQLAESNGVAAIADASLERWFPEQYRHANPDVMRALHKDFSRVSVPGFVSCCQAIKALDTRELLSAIVCPALIVYGTADPGASEPVLRQMSEQIKGSQVLTIDGAGHLSNIDQPEIFTAALVSFLHGSGQIAAEL